MFKLNDGKIVELGMWISDGDCCYEVQEMSDEYVVAYEVDLDEMVSENSKICKRHNLCFLSCNDVSRMKQV